MFIAVPNDHTQSQVVKLAKKNHKRSETVITAHTFSYFCCCWIVFIRFACTHEKCREKFKPSLLSHLKVTAKTSVNVGL